MDLIIESLREHKYRHHNVSNVRLSKKELRWTNAHGEKRSIALVFVTEWKIV